MHDMPHMPDMHCDTPTTPPNISNIVEFILCWPGAPTPTAEAMAMDPTSCCTPGGGSTHELVYDRKGGGTVFWVSGQMYDHIARVTLDGHADYFPMPKDSAPHGMAFDHQGQLWVTLEGSGHLARIGPDGAIVGKPTDVGIYPSSGGRLNTRPHGLGVASDGALWFTGKLTNTVGRVADGKVEHFELPTIGAVPIYLAAGADGDMWCSELTGARIAHITRDGTVHEYATSANSRPIAVAMAPDGKSVWYSAEAGGCVGRIDLLLPDTDPHKVTEFPVPLTRRDAILAGLAFDIDGALWVQQYCPAPPPHAMPTGDDYVVRLGPELHKALPGDLSGVVIAYFKAPSRGTVMHRITQGPDGNIWFTELGINRVGRVNRG